MLQAKMKKRRLLLISTIIPATFALSGCVLLDLLGVKTDEIVVDAPKIEVVNSIKINLQGRLEKTLYPTLSNNSVSNPEFLFATSDSSIATVSEAGVVRGLKEGKAIITVTLKTNTSIKTTVNVVVVDEEINHYDYTIMFYMCGSDLEYNPEAEPDERYPFFTEDIKEILSVHEIPDEVKIIIQTGGTTKWNMPAEYLEGPEGITKISHTNLQRWEVDNKTNKLKWVSTLSTNYMASENSFSEFLSWGLDDYEADQMGVVMSGHGGGIAGCVYDDNYTVKVGKQDWQRTLRTFEVANAAKTALANSSKDKFTWIGYDCCVMQCADIATINSDYFEYMVASQENEDAIGWNHDVYLPYLYNNTTISPTEFLPKICDAFIADKHQESEAGKDICYQTLSVLDLSKTDALVSSFNTLSEKLGTTALSFTKAEAAFKNCFNDFGGKIFGLADFKSFASVLKNVDSSLDTDSVKNAINDLVLYKANCSKYKTSPCGVNAFFPLSLDSEYILQVGKEDYSNSLSTKFSGWQNMCVKYGKFGWDTI